MRDERAAKFEGFVRAAGIRGLRLAELAAATTDRLRRQKEAHRVRDDVPGDLLQCYLELVLDGLVARLASGEDPQRLAAVLDLVENSVRRNDSGPRA